MGTVVADIVLAVILLIPGGLFVTFLSNKFFRITYFIAGYFISQQLLSALGYQIATSYNNGAVPSVTMIIALCAAVAFVFIPALGYASTGALTGYAIAKFILCQANTFLFTNNWITFIYLTVLSGIFVAIIFLEKAAYLLGSTFWGAMFFVTGVDVFAKTGIYTVVLQKWDNKAEYLKTNAAWSMLGAWLLIAILGTFLQNKVFKDEQNKLEPLKFSMPKRNRRARQNGEA